MRFRRPGGLGTRRTFFARPPARVTFPARRTADRDSAESYRVRTIFVVCDDPIARTVA
jgi:hypothetical protein